LQYDIKMHLKGRCNGEKRIELAQDKVQ